MDLEIGSRPCPCRMVRGVATRSPLSAPVHRGLRRAGARLRRNNPRRIVSSQFLATKRPTSFQRRLRRAPRASAQAQEQASTSAPADEATARRNKLAEAFGVSNPNERPSMFGESSASAFTRKQLELARKHPALVAATESTLEDIVTGKSKRRVSMEPMNREMRELCHVVAELYGITSASFGAEPNRHIDFFAGGNKGGALPSVRLSDAVLVDLDTAATKESPASLTRPQDATEYFEGYTKQFSKGEYERLALQFTDITVSVSGQGVLERVCGKLRSPKKSTTTTLSRISGSTARCYRRVGSLVAACAVRSESKSWRRRRKEGGTGGRGAGRRTCR